MEYMHEADILHLELRGESNDRRLADKFVQGINIPVTQGVVHGLLDNRYITRYRTQILSTNHGVATCSLLRQCKLFCQSRIPGGAEKVRSVAFPCMYPSGITHPSSVGLAEKYVRLTLNLSMP